MKKTAYWLLLAALLIMPVRAAYADDGTAHDRLIIGQNFTLPAGETLDGDLVVLAGEVTIGEGALIQGDLVVIGGGLRLDGEARGSAVVIGGSASLGAASSVGRDLVALGGSFQRADGSRIAGDIITNLSVTTERPPRATAIPGPALPPNPDLYFDFGPVGTFAGVLFQALALGLVAMLLSTFLRPQLDRVAQAVQEQPFAAGSLGLLTVFLAPFAIVLMAITLILIPLALAAAFLLVLAWLFGVVALSHVVGERLTQAMHRRWEPVLTAGFGAFIVGVLLGTSNQIPCIGWLASALIGLVGLGAATMTLFGTREQYRGGAPVVARTIDAEGGGPSTPAV
jgi:acetyltransferase-like isoleucine patch superfamily enzyme